mgnify:CR=1 FL=1
MLGALTITLNYSMKFSLITVTLNSGKTVRNTFDSVLKQTYSDFEYILVSSLHFPYSIYVISSAPEMAIPIFVF